MDQMTLFDTSVPWITLWQSDPSIRIRIAPPASEGYQLFSVVPLGTSGPVNPRRGAVCLWIEREIRLQVTNQQDL